MTPFERTARHLESRIARGFLPTAKEIDDLVALRNDPQAQRIIQALHAARKAALN